MFREQNISDQLFDVKRELEDIIESLEDFCPKDIETFNEIKNWKEKVSSIRMEVIDKLTSALEEE